MNVARAALSHINLAGPDPPCARPTWLYVSTKTDFLCTTRLAESLGRYLLFFESDTLWQNTCNSLSRWGTVDIRRLGPKTALIAVGNGAAAEGVVLIIFKCQVQYLHSFHLSQAMTFTGSRLLTEGERHDGG